VTVIGLVPFNPSAPPTLLSPTPRRSSRVQVGKVVGYPDW